MRHNPMPALRALNAKFIHNFVTCDVKAHSAIIHERFVCIMPDGRQMGRKEYLDYWATGFDPNVIVYWDYRDEQISMFGDTALVRSVTKYVRIRDGQEVIGMTAYTDTYFLDGGLWSCVQAQMTPLQPAYYPPDDTIVRRYVRGQIVTEAARGAA